MKPLYVTWANEKGKREALQQAAEAFSVTEPVCRTEGRERFKDIESNLSVKDNFTRQDYEYFRPSETIAKHPERIISACMEAYRKVGIVKNIIDLMAEFACQGIDLVHRNSRLERFYKEWFKKVDGKDRTERFLNYLYRVGNVVVKRETVKLNASKIKLLHKGMAKIDIKNIDSGVQPQKYEVPWRYHFLNPLSLEVIGKELAVFAGLITFGLKVPATLCRRIKSPRTDREKHLVSVLPAFIVRAVRRGSKLVPLPEDKISFFSYKKDDWDMWAMPLTHAILDDLILLEKMKLADLAALDGAISHIRLWRLGSLEHKILPTPEAISRLARILLSNTGGGSIDLIWGPELDVKETSTDVQKFLGEEKYIPVMNNIYAGLGVPPTLTGAATSSGFTNNFISLKTLVERLAYGRNVVKSFWDAELKLVQQAMNHRFAAQIVFDRMTLSDEAAEKALLIQLVDRNLMSAETVQERFGEIPEIERLRIRREMRARKKGTMPRKASPWHSPEYEEALEKIFVQKGVVTPSEVGLELQERKENERTALEIQTELRQLDQPNTGVPGQGRPKNSKDSQKRKQKTVKPIGAEFMSNFTWAKEAQKQIGDILNPCFLKLYNKKNMRSLSAEEFEKTEKLKAAVLYKIEPYTEITQDLLFNFIQNSEPLPDDGGLYDVFIQELLAKTGRSLTIEEKRGAQAMVCACLHT